MTMHTVSVPPLPASISVTSSAEAYARMRPLFESVTDDQLVTINVDIPLMAARLLAHADAIQSLIPAATARIVGFDPTPFLQVRTRAMALLQAHSLHVTAATPVVDDLPALREPGNQLRTRLLDAAQYLARHGLLDASQLTTIKGLPGYRNQAVELMALSNLLRSVWSVASTKSALTQDDLDKATALAERLFAAVAVREQSERVNAQTALIRHKAYSLVFREYDEIRSIVTFLRWKQDDAEDFAPSLFTGRRSGRREETPDAQDGDEQAHNPGAPVPPPTPGAAGHSPAAPEPAVPVGHEGGSPFVG